MTLLDDLLAIEHRLATGGAPEYREVLTEDALVIVPGAVLDKEGCVAAMEATPGWDSVDFDSARLIESPGVASVVYRFAGMRGDNEYRAVLASSYRMPELKLFLHQQTTEG